MSSDLSRPEPVRLQYELDYDGYPEQTYRLMNLESKKKWRCKMCVRNKKFTSIGETSNVTTRKKQSSLKTPSPTEILQHVKNNPRTGTSKDQPTIQNTSENDSHVLTDCETSDESFITPNKLSRSFDGTISDLVKVSEMKDIISQLTLKLQSAECELENVMLENTDLHKQIAKLITEVTTLKSLCQSPSMFGTPINMMKKKKEEHREKLNSTLSTPASLKSKLEPADNVILNLKQKISTLQQQLQLAEQEVTTLKTRIKSLIQQNHNSTSSLSSSRVHTTQELKRCPATSTSPLPTHRRVMEPEKRIFVFGTQRCVGLAAAISHSRTNTSYEKYRVIAETMPNALCSEITASCRSIKPMPDDKLLICLGTPNDIKNLGKYDR
ncbi:hypothetical protein HW555_003140 [Spodoptera exigua]|uniref:Uncharacterized protein n=1 Tax=Spodoptera exigua TaxID=7107 RepID=A0A835L8U3_SPOEX|nr:hypothetical protein HW555_003140 [Spodoptera exigua]